MAIETRTIDEETAALVDEYDKYVAPYSIFRNNNNKLFLVFRSIAAGFIRLRDVVIALKYRFDARYADDDDLASAMLITGEQAIPGKSSMVRCVVFNTDFTDHVYLYAGKYIHISAEDQQPFYYELGSTFRIEARSFVVLLFASRDAGMFRILNTPGAAINREDSQAIDNRITWELLANESSLGRPEESMYDIRRRLLTNTRRQDALQELETAIRALPTIFAADLIFNAKDEYSDPLPDGTVLPPKTLHIILTGMPTKEFAELVLSKTVYNTFMTVASNVVWYDNPLFAGGRYPVYFTPHARRKFYLLLHYSYDRAKMSKENVDAAFEALLHKYRVMVEHIDEINEPLLYEDLRQHDIPGVRLHKVYIQDMNSGELTPVEKIDVPKLSIPELAGVSFVAELDPPPKQEKTP